MEIVIVGGGIGGLTLALGLDAVGIGCQIFEAAAEFKPLGVGINLQPHSIRALAELGLQDALARVAVEPQDYAFFTSHGQLVYREAWGRAAGHQYPHFSVHRAALHQVLLDAAIARLGAERVQLGHRCIGAEQDDTGAIAHFVDAEGKQLPARRGDAVIGCDGIHSNLRRQFYPQEGKPVFHGINLWRGITRRRPFLTGRSIARIGATRNTLIVYPIRDNIDGAGTQLINWVGEVKTLEPVPVDWNSPGSPDDILRYYRDWRFDWLDCVEMISQADLVLSYPMVDRDPVERWSYGRITLLGDAAHPMFPQGGNGGAQAILDARALPRYLVSEADAGAALAAYEAERLPAVNRIVLANRASPPNTIVDTVEKLTHGKRFERLEDVISPAELKAIFERYQRVAGYHPDIVGRQSQEKN